MTTTVRDLVDKNPVIIEAFIDKDSWFRRIKGEGYWQMIRKYNEPVSDQDRRIGYVVQTLMYAIKLGMAIVSARFIASRIGPVYWQVAKYIITAGWIFGLLSGKLSPFETIKFQGDIYASYKTRFKILQPLHDLAFNSAMLALLLLTFQKNPGLGYLHAIFFSFILSSEVGATQRFVIQKLFF